MTANYRACVKRKIELKRVCVRKESWQMRAEEDFFKIIVSEEKL